LEDSQNLGKKRIDSKSLLPFVSGLLIILSQPPFPFFFLAYFSIVPLLLSLKEDGSKADFFSGLKTGIIAFTGLIYWVVIAMNRYGGINIGASVACMLLLSLYLALYTAFFTYILSFLRSKLSVPTYLCAPFVWTLLEYVRNYMLSGFPWALLAYSQHSFLPFIQICSFTGPYYISFLIVSMNCAIVILLKGLLRVRSGLIFFLFVVCASSFSIFYGVLKLKEDYLLQDGIRVGIIQASIRQDVKWTEDLKMKSLQKHMISTIRAERESDFFVWSETALPFVLEEKEGVLKTISELAKSMGKPILTGSLSRDKERRLYNAAFLLGKDGRVLGIYRKVHLVPFGEYTPLARYFPFLEKISVTGEDFSPGKDHNPLSLEGFGKVGILICYEGIFPDISRETVRRGANLLVNLTNDAWYDRSSAPYQHLAFYIFRAVETERYVVRCANTGISAIIDPKGRIIRRSRLFTEEVLCGQVFGISKKTFYVIYGDWFVLISLLFFLSTIGYHFLIKSSGSKRDIFGT